MSRAAHLPHRLAIRTLLEGGTPDATAVRAFLEGREFPLVEGDSVTFVWTGEADAVRLRHFIFGLPASRPFARVPGTVDPVSPEACNRTVPVFDGRLRYDLKLAHKRMERVKADKGYEGPVVVCALYFAPIAGYIPDRPAIKYLIAQRDMEVWLAPIAGTRVVVPFRFSVPTPLGLGVLEATQFISLAQPPRAASAKVQ